MLQLNQKLVLRERYAKFHSVLSKEDSAVAITKLNITETERLFCYKKQTNKQTNKNNSNRSRTKETKGEPVAIYWSRIPIMFLCVRFIADFP